MRTTEDPAHPPGKLVCSEKPLRLYDLALGVYPLGLDGVQPRTLLRKQATDDPHALAALLDFSVVSSKPPSHLFGDMRQLALSQMRTRNFLPISSSFSRLHERNRLVIEETGLPSTNLIHVSSISGR